MSNTIHAFGFLDRASKSPTIPSVAVIFGDEPFLQRLVMKQIRRDVLNDETDNVPSTKIDGESAEWRDVVDELSTRSLFGSGRRFVLVDAADRFVSKFRSELEDYVKHPRATGALVLQVGTWPSNTRLFKSIDKQGLQVECRAPQKTSGRRKVPDERRLLDWLADWSARQHDAVLSPRAAELLLQLISANLGLLDQELAKLALFAGPGGEISPDMVRDVVGGWRTKTTWEMIDAATDGDAAEALRQLDNLLQSGENPLALFGSISWSLRRFAAATRLVQMAEQHGQRISLPAALERAGFKKWPHGAMDNAARQLRQLRRERAGRLYQWLLETDLALKGSHSTPRRARFILEQLMVRLSKQTAAL